MALSAQRLGSNADTPAGATTVLYTVPSGRRSILRDVRADVGVAGGEIWQLRINEAGTAHNVDILRQGTTAVQTVLALQDVFIVLEQGDAIEVVVGVGSNGDCWLSGHEFVLP